MQWYKSPSSGVRCPSKHNRQTEGQHIHWLEEILVIKTKFVQSKGWLSAIFGICKNNGPRLLTTVTWGIIHTYYFIYVLFYPQIGYSIMLLFLTDRRMYKWTHISNCGITVYIVFIWVISFNFIIQTIWIWIKLILAWSYLKKKICSILLHFLVMFYQIKHKHLLLLLFIFVFIPIIFNQTTLLTI